MKPKTKRATSDALDFSKYEYGIVVGNSGKLSRRDRITGVVEFILWHKGDQSYVDGIGHKNDVWISYDSSWFINFKPTIKTCVNMVTLTTKQRRKRTLTRLSMWLACGGLYSLLYFGCSHDEKTQVIRCPMPAHCDSVVNNEYEPLKTQE